MRMLWPSDKCPIGKGSDGDDDGFCGQMNRKNGDKKHIHLSRGQRCAKKGWNWVKWTDVMNIITKITWVKGQRLVNWPNSKFVKVL